MQRYCKTDVFVSAATGAEPLHSRTPEDTSETGTTDNSTEPEASHQTVPSGRGWSFRIKHA